MLLDIQLTSVDFLWNECDVITIYSQCVSHFEWNEKDLILCNFKTINKIIIAKKKTLKKGLKQNRKWLPWCWNGLHAITEWERHPQANIAKDYKNLGTKTAKIKQCDFIICNVTDNVIIDICLFEDHDAI